MISLFISEEIMGTAIEKTSTRKGDCGQIMEDLNTRLWSMSFSLIEVFNWIMTEKKMKYLIEVL